MSEHEGRKESKRVLPAMTLVTLMILSTQLMIFEKPSVSVEEEESIEPSKRTAYPQMGQVSAPVQGDGQYQPATTNPFQNPAFSPFYNDAASIYGKVSDLSALGLDPSYGFFLEETNTDDHDNDGINDLDDLDDLWTDVPFLSNAVPVAT